MKVFYPFGSKGIIAETGSKKGVRSAWLDLCRIMSSCASHTLSTDEAPFKAGLPTSVPLADDA